MLLTAVLADGAGGRASSWKCPLPAASGFLWDSPRHRASYRDVFRLFHNEDTTCSWACSLAETSLWPTCPFPEKTRPGVIDSCSSKTPRADIKGNLQLQPQSSQKANAETKMAFPSFHFGIYQSQTQEMWWHSKSLWLIHAGPQVLPLGATWWSSYHHLVFLSSQTVLLRTRVTAGVEIGLGARAPSITVMQISFIHTPHSSLA